MKLYPASCKAVLFDLDGTLIDHFRIIFRCYEYALQYLGLPPVSFERVKASVGGSIEITFGKLIDKKYVPEAVNLYRKHFDQIWHEDIEILEGSEWILKNLVRNGIRCAVFTNKEGDRSRKILKHTGLDQYLKLTVGTLDTPWRKPQPEFTQHVLNQLSIASEFAIMIGDSPYDVMAAEAGNLPCYGVATGSHTKEQLVEDTNAAGVFNDLYDLGESVFGYKR